MYKIATDCHIHTIFSLHAYSTIEECAEYAAAQGMGAIAIADHLPAVPTGDPGQKIAQCAGLKILPPVIKGVRVLHGAEIDIVDVQGNLANAATPCPDNPAISLMDHALEHLDLVIASIHWPGEKIGVQTEHTAQNTEMYCRVLENSRVVILGHPSRVQLDFDMEKVVRTAKVHNKLIEINEACFERGPTVAQRCYEMARWCKRIGTFIAVNSDAHCAHAIGRYPRAQAMLEELEFPEELIANRTLSSLEPYLLHER